MALEIHRVLGSEIGEGDILGGRTVAEVIRAGFLRCDDEAQTKILINTREYYMIHRVVAIAAPERIDCAFCGKSVGATSKSTMLPHGPKADRCKGSGLTADEARAEADELAEREALTA
jgi:hypothetical protein